MDADLIGKQLGLQWFSFQLDVFEKWEALAGHKRFCLYYRTGAGKTLTSLAMMRMDNVTEVLVLAPPSTHARWVEEASRLGIEAEVISHAKFRMKDYKVSRTKAVICDEFHLLGGQRAQGWKKFSRYTRALQAPAIIMSATPNYNDAERCYCIHYVLDPLAVKGGFLQFLNSHCVTEHDPFSTTPKVKGFLKFNDAAEYLAALPLVAYVPDQSTTEIIDVNFDVPLPQVIEAYGYLPWEHRIFASIIERNKKISYYKRVSPDGEIREEVMDELVKYLDTDLKVLIYVNRARIANILYQTLLNYRFSEVDVVTGSDTTKRKADKLKRFIEGDTSILIGTATLATGVDGMDKVCNDLLIFDDTPDDSLRRQVMGRILPRGSSSDESLKVILRYNFL